MKITRLNFSQFTISDCENPMPCTPPQIVNDVIIGWRTYTEIYLEIYVPK